MCPPLQLGPGTQHDDLGARTTPAHILGFVTNLSDDERNGIETQIADIATRTPARAAMWDTIEYYVMVPPIREVTDIRTGTRRFTQFSCVGFVLDCYQRGANIKLLDWSSPKYPTADLSALVAQYDHPRFILDPSVRARIGLTGTGPWPVALPGHLFHSLSRSDRRIRRRPYLPRSADESHFPPSDSPRKGCLVGGLFLPILWFQARNVST